MITVINDVHENVRRFDEEEAVWKRYEEKRARRKRLHRLLCFLDPKPALAEEELDQLDWLAAEREMRGSDCARKNSFCDFNVREALGGDHLISPLQGGNPPPPSHSLSG